MFIEESEIYLLAILITILDFQNEDVSGSFAKKSPRAMNSIHEQEKQELIYE